MEDERRIIMRDDGRLMGMNSSMEGKSEARCSFQAIPWAAEFLTNAGPTAGWFAL
jgi:hypothetical protein